MNQAELRRQAINHRDFVEAHREYTEVWKRLSAGKGVSSHRILRVFKSIDLYLSNYYAWYVRKQPLPVRAAKETGPPRLYLLRGGKG